MTESLQRSPRTYILIQIIASIQLIDICLYDLDGNSTMIAIIGWCLAIVLIIALLVVAVCVKKKLKKKKR